MYAALCSLIMGIQIVKAGQVRHYDNNNTNKMVWVLNFSWVRRGSAPVVAPVAQRYPCNLLRGWDVSSIPANGIFLTKKLKTKTKNAQRVEND